MRVSTDDDISFTPSFDNIFWQKHIENIEICGINSYVELFVSNTNLDYRKSSIFYGPTNYEMRLDKLFVKTFQPKQRTLR